MMVTTTLNYQRLASTRSLHDFVLWGASDVLNCHLELGGKAPHIGTNFLNVTLRARMYVLESTMILKHAE